MLEPEQLPELPVELPPVISSRTNSLGFHSHWDFLGNGSVNLRKGRTSIRVTASSASQTMSLLQHFQAIQLALKALKGRDTLGRQVRGRRHRAGRRRILEFTGAEVCVHSFSLKQPVATD